MNKNFRLKMVLMPNFIAVETPAGKREEGFKGATSIPINELSREEAEKYAEEMKETFLNHWRSKVENGE